LRGSNGDIILPILEVKIFGKKARGQPRRIWMDDIYECTANKTYGEVKRLAADTNLLIKEDGTNERRNSMSALASRISHLAAICIARFLYALPIIS